MESTCLTLNPKIIYMFESAFFEKVEECKAKGLQLFLLQSWFRWSWLVVLTNHCSSLEWQPWLHSYCLAFHKLFHPSWGDVAWGFRMWCSHVFLDKVLCLRWRLYFLVFWWQLGCHIVSGLGVIKWHFHPRFWPACVLWDACSIFWRYVRTLTIEDSRLTSNNPEGFPMIPMYFFDFSLRYRFAGRSLASQGPDMFQDVASASCAPLTTVSVDGYGYGMWNVMLPRMFCSAQAGVQCNFIVHTALERPGRRRRRDRTVNGPQHAVSQTFQTVFSAFLCFFVIQVHILCLPWELHWRTATHWSAYIFFNSRLSEAPYVKSLQVHVRARCFEMLVLQNPTFLQVLKISYIWPFVRDRILFSGSLRLARLFPRNMIEYHVRIFQSKVLSILKCCDYVSIWSRQPIGSLASCERGCLGRPWDYGTE